MIPEWRQSRGLKTLHALAFKPAAPVCQVITDQPDLERRLAAPATENVSNLNFKPRK
jgi:hypothetical protein